MSSSFSGSSIVAVICGIEAILGSLSPLVSGDAFNMEDNNSFMYSQFYSSDIFFSNRFCNFFFVEKFVFTFPIFCCDLSIICATIII